MPLFCLKNFSIWFRMANLKSESQLMVVKKTVEKIKEECYFQRPRKYYQKIK